MKVMKKSKFKSSYLKYKWKRIRVILRRMARSVDTKMSYEQQTITTYEEKAVKLWKMLLKDDETQMAYNTFGTRQIEKENVFMIFQPKGNGDYLMTLVDVTAGRKSLYELHIPQKQADFVCDYFDKEMEKRMKTAEKSALSIIEHDIDSLLAIEEKNLIEKNKK